MVRCRNGLSDRPKPDKHSDAHRQQAVGYAVVNAELENLVFGPRKEFITMAILVLINIPLVRFINKDWYHTLVATIPGQMVIAVCLAAVFVSFAFVVKLTQPIEYRR